MSTRDFLGEHGSFWYLSYQRKQSWCFSCRVLVRASNVLTKYQLGVQLAVTLTAEDTKRENLPMRRTPTEGRAVSVPTAGESLICHFQWFVYNAPAVDDIQRNILIKNNEIYQRGVPSLHSFSGRSDSVYMPPVCILSSPQVFKEKKHCSISTLLHGCVLGS